MGITEEDRDRSSGIIHTRGQKLKVRAPNAPWYIRHIINAIARRNLSAGAVAKRAGVAENSIRRWNARAQSPGFGNVEAVLEVLGYEIRIVKKGESDAGVGRP
jgi:hypothetical protein